MADTIPLRTAYLCVDCDTIGDCASQCCTCGSQSLLSLAKVLNRQTTPKLVRKARTQTA